MRCLTKSVGRSQQLRSKPTLGECWRLIHEPRVQPELPLPLPALALGGMAGSASSRKDDRSMGARRTPDSLAGRGERSSIRPAPHHVRHRFSPADVASPQTMPLPGHSSRDNRERRRNSVFADAIDRSFGCYNSSGGVSRHFGRSNSLASVAN